MKCLNCDNYTTNKKFCNRSCSATYNNKKFPKRNFSKSCKICDTKIPYNKTFCTDEHRKLFYENSEWNLSKKKMYMANYAKTYHQKLKTTCIEYLGSRCSMCGYNKSNTALCFHHIDPKTKVFTISSKARKFETIKPELDKCILLCLNCHAELHEMLLAGIEPTTHNLKDWCDTISP